MKKLLKIITAAALCMSLFAPHAAAQDHVHAYWALQENYLNAQNSGNTWQIINAAKAIVDLYQNPANKSQYNAAAWPCQAAAKLYEQTGDFDNARIYYEKFLSYITWLNNTGEDFNDSIKQTNAILKHLRFTPQVYVEAQYPADYPYMGAKCEPQNGIFTGKCNTFDSVFDSAYLLYAHYFNEELAPFDYLIPKDGNVTLELAWNLPNENLSDIERVADGSSDEYLIRNLQYLAGLSNPVLLRFAAEVNCWQDIPQDANGIQMYTDAYKKAFRRVSDFARTYAPRAAMVYSPADVSNWYVTAADFYPGDEYVDWIGMSMYDNISPAASNTAGDGNDAYYCRGVYENAIVKIDDIVNGISQTKPVMISECGFAYDDSDGAQNIFHATEKLKEFYTYVNMVYPRVKGIFYFNADKDKNYSLSGNYALSEAYNAAVSANVAVRAHDTGVKCGYTRFNTVNETMNFINLYTCALYPSFETVSVGYTIDGAGVPSVPEFPYYASVDVSTLAAGYHVLQAAVSCADYYKTYDYGFYVGENGFVSAKAIYEDIGVNVNGKKLCFDAQPRTVNDRTLVPLRAIFEALGAQVIWHEETQSITAQRADTSISLAIGSGSMNVNGKSCALDAPPQIFDGRTMVPVRAIAESFGCSVDWNEGLKLVSINE